MKVKFVLYIFSLANRSLSCWLDFCWSTLVTMRWLSANVDVTFSINQKFSLFFCDDDLMCEYASSRPTKCYLIWIIDLKLTNFNYISSSSQRWLKKTKTRNCRARLYLVVDYTHKNATEQSISTHNPIINFINETKENYEWRNFSFFTNPHNIEYVCLIQFS